MTENLERKYRWNDRRARMAENLERKYSWNDRRGQNDRKAVANRMIAARLYNDETKFKFADCFCSSQIVFVCRSLPICVRLICAPKILTGRVSEMNMFVTRCLLLKVLSNETAL